MNIANILSFSRLIITALNLGLFLSMLNQDIAYQHFILTMITTLFIIGVISDFLDGFLARKYNLITNLGKFIDPIADKILVTSTLVMLCLFSFFPQSFIAPYQWWLILFTILIIIRDIIVDFIRFIAIEHNVVLAANMWGKVKTTSQMIAIILLLLNTFMEIPILGTMGMSLLALATLLTLYSGWNYFVKIKKYLK